MLLAIDVGNTRIKAAVFEVNTLIDVIVFDLKEFTSQVDRILNHFPKIEDIVVASVGKLNQSALLFFENKVRIHFITHQSTFPFQNAYTTPTTLGIDRMVLAAGAVLEYPNQNRLVIDLGTCITYDFVDASDTYRGGAISAGIRLRYEALHFQTAKLPLLHKSYPENFIGNSTVASIHSGVINGVIYEIEGFIKEYESQYAKFIIILTGGDAEFLANRLKNTIFANSNFLLESLSQTFQYNQK